MLQAKRYHALKRLDSYESDSQESDTTNSVVDVVDDVEDKDQKLIEKIEYKRSEAKSSKHLKEYNDSDYVLYADSDITEMLKDKIDVEIDNAVLKSIQKAL